LVLYNILRCTLTSVVHALILGARPPLMMQPMSCLLDTGGHIPTTLLRASLCRCSRCPEPLLNTPLRCEILFVTPCIQNLLTCPNSAHEMSLHTCSSSLTLLFSLRVKGLTRRCYVWNDNVYKLALTLINFEGSTKPTKYNHTCANFAITTFYEWAGLH